MLCEHCIVRARQHAHASKMSSHRPVRGQTARRIVQKPSRFDGALLRLYAATGRLCDDTVTRPTLAEGMLLRAGATWDETPSVPELHTTAPPISATARTR